MTTQSQASNPTKPRRVVVGVDGSEPSDRALNWAAAEADRSHAVLEVVAAFNPGYEFITPDEVRETWVMRHSP